MKSINRILTIFAITYRESLRRKLVLVFVASCVLFSMAGACTAKLISMKLAENSQGTSQKNVPDKATYLQQAKDYYSTNGMKGKELVRRMAQEESRYEDMKAKQTPEAKLERTQKTNEIGEFIVTVFCFILFASWSYLLAALFTPFIALNDLYLGSHVLLLAGPLKRWEYLSGKFLAILAMVLSSLFLMLLTFHIGMLVLYGHPGFAILEAIPLLIQGLSLFIFMIILFSFTLGRIPAVLLSLVVLFLSAVPAIPILGNMEMDSNFGQWLKFSGYAIPQLGVNFFTALVYAIDQYEQARQFLSQIKLDISKIGTTIQYWSMLINTGWMFLLGGLSIWLFQKKELDT